MLMLRVTQPRLSHACRSQAALVHPVL